MSITTLRNNQSGLVSIIVAIAFITIITLISTGFALLSRRESRQALDRQLSTQAFYAAESGINDAIRAIRSGASDITSCDGVNGLNQDAGAGPTLSDSMAYTCVLIDESPTSLQFNPVETDGSRVARVQAASNIAKIRISWQDREDSNTFAPTGLPLLPQAGYRYDNIDSFANHTGILRSLIIPVAGNLIRQDLINNSQTLFLYPRAGTSAGVPGSYGYQAGQGTTGQTSQGAIVDGQCNTGNTPSSPSLPQFCNVDINVSAAGTNVFYINLRSIYQSTQVTIQAFNSTSPDQPLELLSGQAVIDATGRATDVLRRVQVRVPVNNSYVIPDFAIETSDDICKKISVSTSAVDDECTYN